MCTCRRRWVAIEFPRMCGVCWAALCCHIHANIMFSNGHFVTYFRNDTGRDYGHSLHFTPLLTICMLIADMTIGKCGDNAPIHEHYIRLHFTFPFSIFLNRFAWRSCWPDVVRCDDRNKLYLVFIYWGTASLIRRPDGNIWIESIYPIPRPRPRPSS